MRNFSMLGENSLLLLFLNENSILSIVWTSLLERARLSLATVSGLLISTLLCFPYFSR